MKKIFTSMFLLLAVYAPMRAQTNTISVNDQISDSLWLVIQQIRTDTLYRMLHKAVARIQDVEAKNADAINAFLLKYADVISSNECQNMLLAEFESDLIKEYTMLQCARQQISTAFLTRYANYFAQDASDRLLWLRHCSRDDWW